jgi:V/A-type H+-transporting ATPase subunit C
MWKTAASENAEAWTFASGLVSAREGRLLPAGFFQQVLAEPNLEGVYRRLSETVLQGRVAAREDLHRADELAAAAFRDLLTETRPICPAPRVADLFDLRDRFTSFKWFVKRTEMGIEPPPGAGSSAHDETWERLWADLPVELPAPFQYAAERARLAVHAAPKRPELLDAAVDSVCLAALCEEAERTGSPFVAGYFRRHDAAKGVEMLWRARIQGLGENAEDFILHGRQDDELFHALAARDEADWPEVLRVAMDGLATARLAEAAGLDRVRAFVAAADEWLMDYARQAKAVTFGPERVFGYLVAMEAELYNLRVAAGGRAAGIAPELLAGRLRACYC